MEYLINFIHLKSSSKLVTVINHPKPHSREALILSLEQYISSDVDSPIEIISIEVFDISKLPQPKRFKFQILVEDSAQLTSITVDSPTFNIFSKSEIGNVIETFKNDLGRTARILSIKEFGTIPKQSAGSKLAVKVLEFLTEKF
ncbi:MAG: hypothetical protein WBB28_14590 [Crinalium sp.]